MELLNQLVTQKERQYHKGKQLQKVQSGQYSTKRYENLSGASGNTIHADGQSGELCAHLMTFTKKKGSSMNTEALNMSICLENAAL